MPKRFGWVNNKRYLCTLFIYNGQQTSDTGTRNKARWATLAAICPAGYCGNDGFQSL